MADKASGTNVPQVCGICGTGGVLFRCSRCKCVNYCSTPCQAEDWPIHKKMCKVLANPQGKKHAAHLDIKPYEGKHPATLIWLKEISNYGEETYVYSPGFLQSGAASQFEDLPVTSALGFPLCYGGDLTGMPDFMNQPVAQLFVDIDTTSATFGREMKRPLGGACLARRDGRHISIMHVQALIYHVEYANQELLRVPGREENGESVDREEIVKRLLTPKAFARAFERIKQSKVMVGQACWADLECPVKVRGEQEKEKQDMTA
ncbi:Egl nine 1 [Elasticomyces elasticus]|nr:Egl nine 1 [Elasticomyces elasticus]